MILVIFLVLEVLGLQVWVWYVFQEVKQEESLALLLQWVILMILIMYLMKWGISLEQIILKIIAVIEIIQLQ